MPALNLDYRTATRTLDWKKLPGIQDPREVVAQHDWVTKTPRTSWLDGIPLGNGDMCAMLYGSPNRMVWLLNKSDIWDHRVPGLDSNLPPVPYRQIANWVADQDWKSLARIEERGKNLQPRHYTSIQPAAWMVLEPIGESTFTQFTQTHSLLTGEVTTEFETDFLCSPLKLSHYIIQSFLAADQNVLRIRIEADKPLRSIRARLLRPIGHYPPNPIFRHRGTLLLLQAQFPDNMTFVVGLESDIPSRLASQDSNESSIIFDDIDDTSLELRLVVACSETTASPEDRVRATLNVEKPQRYRGAIRRNQQAMEKYWYRSGFVWKNEPELEKHWYLSQYLLGTCSAVGKQAPGLQGQWSGHVLPPWFGGYRTDLHLQMNNWSTFTTNRLDLAEPYIRLFCSEIREQMRSDTARHWGWGGIKIPLCFGPRGQEIATWLPAKLWPGGTAWVAIDFLRYWEYSSDTIYLTTIAYNFAMECAEFLENWLFQSGTERIELGPSFCPNQGKGTPEAWVFNSTADIALLRTLFKKLIEISQHPEIREDPRRLERWQYILDHLPDYPVQNGKWCDSRTTDWNEPHRYLSKMMPVYPTGEVSMASSKSDFQVALETFEQLEQFGFSNAAGFTMVWLAGIAVRLGLYKKGIHYLKEFNHKFTRVNGMNRHYPLEADSHSDILQIDANLGYAAVVSEMFLQWTEGVLRLFPAAESDTTAQFWGWRTPGGHLVAADMVDGNLEGLLIEATRPGTLRMISPFKQAKLTYKLRLKSKVEVKTIANKKGMLLTFDLKNGQRFEFGSLANTPIGKKSSAEEES